MLTIRLQRTGKKNQADFRIVLAEKAAHVSKRVVEILGSYNPHKKNFVLKNPERLNYWMAQRVQLSPTIHNLLVEKGFLKADKVQAFKVPKKPAEPVAEEAPAAAPEAPSEVVAEAPTEAASESTETENKEETPAEQA